MRSYISRIFNGLFKKTFTSAVNGHRIYHARGLVRSDLSITFAEIAFASGACSLGNLTEYIYPLPEIRQKRKSKG